MIVRFKRFTRIQILKRIGRDLLERFLQQFEPELRGQGLTLPEPGVDDAAYFLAVGRLLAAPDQLPARLNEALFAIDELSSPEGQEQLELALARTGLEVALTPASSREDMVLELWLAQPELVTRVHNQQRLRRLTTFEHFGTSVAPAERPPFSSPTREMLDALAASLDPWFARHQRGHNTTRIELCNLGGPSSNADCQKTSAAVAQPKPTETGTTAVQNEKTETETEFCFVVRHGDSFARTPKVEAQETEILHFRPERDDVIVYSSRHDELRINARTKGERDLYVRMFGFHLRGREDYFSSHRTYTLEPLRLAGRESLEPAGDCDIAKIVLRQIEIAWENPLLGRTIREADDIFAAPAEGAALARALPGSGRIARAAFDVHFHHSRRPRPVQIRLPNILKVGRHCDAQSVDRWLCRRGFRLDGNTEPGSH